MNGNSDEKKRFAGLQCHEYEHRGEKELQNSLNSNKAVEKLFALISEYGFERWELLKHIGSDMEVKDTNFSELYAVLSESCGILDINPIPKMYLEQNKGINACAMGINNPIITVTQGAVDKLSTEELYYLIGHEAGHIKSKHTRYGFLRMVLPFLEKNIPIVGGLVSTGVSALLYRYDRLAEYTADRTGLLCCQNLDAATTVLMKLCGYPEKYKDDFIKQFDEFKDYNENLYNKALNFLANMTMDHPWPVLRGKELYDWVQTKGYEAVLNRDQNRVTDSSQGAYCGNCGKESVEGAFCPHCGAKY